MAPPEAQSSPLRAVPGVPSVFIPWKRNGPQRASESLRAKRHRKTAPMGTVLRLIGGRGRPSDGPALEQEGQRPQGMEKSPGDPPGTLWSCFPKYLTVIWSKGLVRVDEAAEGSFSDPCCDGLAFQTVGKYRVMCSSELNEAGERMARSLDEEGEFFHAFLASSLAMSPM